MPNAPYLWCPIMKSIFDYKFRFYTLKMNEICLHCHLLYFSSIILSFGHFAFVQYLVCQIFLDENSRQMKDIWECVCCFLVFYLQQSKTYQMPPTTWHIGVSSTLFYFHFLVHLHSNLVISLLVLFVTRMATQITT